MVHGRLGSLEIYKEVFHRCTHRSTTVRRHSTFQSTFRPLSHHRRCPNILGTGSPLPSPHLLQKLHLPQLLHHHHHHHLPLSLLPSTQLAAAQTLAAASC